MDDYPADLAPEFEETGAVKTPFLDWWVKVRDHFPTVPEEVAEDWLHRHWSHSLYSYLPSRFYRFSKVKWAAADLWKIQSGWCNFDPANAQCVAQGEYQANNTKGVFANNLAVYIGENGDFPKPIIVLDNQDSHLCADKVDMPYKALPQGYVLIEGHRRFNLGLHFQRAGKLKPEVTVWLMTRS